jgi:hypothetical protein
MFRVMTAILLLGNIEFVEADGLGKFCYKTNCIWSMPKVLRNQDSYDQTQPATLKQFWPEKT